MVFCSFSFVDCDGLNSFFFSVRKAVAFREIWIEETSVGANKKGLDIVSHKQYADTVKRVEGIWFLLLFSCLFSHRPEYTTFSFRRYFVF
jgi:hypothetical protein